MFKIFIATAITVFSASSFALDTLTCGFTEPFITVEYDANTQIVTKTDAVVVDPTTGMPITTVLSERAELQLVDVNIPGAYNLVDVATGNTLMGIELTGNGTDGMSDQVYPFSAVYQNNYGGCSTQTAPVIDQIKVMEQLGSSFY